MSCSSTHISRLEYPSVLFWFGGVVSLFAICSWTDLKNPPHRSLHHSVRMCCRYLRSNIFASSKNLSHPLKIELTQPQGLPDLIDTNRVTGFEKRSHKYINFETKLKNQQASFEENSCKRASWNDWIIYRKRLYKGGRSFSGGTLCGIWESGERQKSSRDLGSLAVREAPFWNVLVL